MPETQKYKEYKFTLSPTTIDIHIGFIKLQNMAKLAGS